MVPGTGSASALPSLPGFCLPIPKVSLGLGTESDRLFHPLFLILSPLAGPFFSNLLLSEGNPMALCATCNQPISETVIQGRKLIAQVHRGTGKPTVGRYLTVLNLTCACGQRIERRYENRPAREVKFA